MANFNCKLEISLKLWLLKSFTKTLLWWIHISWARREQLWRKLSCWNSPPKKARGNILNVRHQSNPYFVNKKSSKYGNIIVYINNILVSGQTNHIKTRVAVSLNVIEKLLDGFHYVYDTQYDCKFFDSTTRQFKMNGCNNKINKWNLKRASDVVKP